MAEIVGLKSGISTFMERVSKRTETCELSSELSIIPVMPSGLNLVVRRTSAVKTEETEA